MFMLSQFTRFASVLLATGGPLASTFQSPVQTNDIAQCPDAGESNTLGNHKNPTLSFANSQWMWTTELSGGNAPVGSRGFRKTFVSPYGKTPAFLTIAYAADDMATLHQQTHSVSGDSRDTPQILSNLRVIKVL
ncbi:hypothetical protein F5878DRAFT_720723 [Lentinula raphanica]|uniref:Uncharacterized protein n=1 Tax=Lentinula raphanica TaxID=153919 RepID=A0AA38PK16_9AGAR|nr:hypothetical protein F5878DRAFT_720723 [Lentinula raphanica]